jgi:hypothetical protein
LLARTSKGTSGILVTRATLVAMEPALDMSELREPRAERWGCTFTCRHKAVALGTKELAWRCHLKWSSDISNHSPAIYMRRAFQ